MNENLKDTLAMLDTLLSSTDLTDVTAESTGFENLPDGYYLCEVEKAELKESKSSHMPMAALQFKVIEDGHAIELSDEGDVHSTIIKNTKKRKIFLYYVLKDERSIKRFVTDMLKFESTDGESLLPKDAFTTSEVLEDALTALIGFNVYVQVSTTVNDDDTTSTWQNIISWKRATALELPQ